MAPFSKPALARKAKKGTMRAAVSIALFGFLAVFFTSGITWVPDLLPFPGMTSDEPFSVSYGSAFIDAVQEHGMDFFSRDVINSEFGPRREHPPLARWLIGLSHRILGQGSFFDGRGASASSFALCLFLVTVTGCRCHSLGVGVSAGIALLLMPRVFGHAHFAALETIVMATWLIAMLSAYKMMERPGWGSAIVAGSALGLALLTKMQGVLLIPAITIWALFYYRKNAPLKLIAWFVTGAAVFFLGWPWLWHSTWDRSTEYFGRAGSRTRILVSYPEFHPLRLATTPTIYKDARDDEQLEEFPALPWHYPIVMTAATLPIGILALGILGVAVNLHRLKSDPVVGLFFVWFFFPLALFSLPTVPVYDGVRLFLMIFPAWAYWAARGGEFLWTKWEPRTGRRCALSLATLFWAFQSIGVVLYQPFHLSYYSSLVGGLSGAARMGFEPTYWGDTITPELVNRWSDLAKESSEAVIVPTFYANHARVYETQRIQSRSQKLQNGEASSSLDWIVYNRRAYLQDLDAELQKQPPLVINERDGVWLAAIYRIREPKSDHSEKNPPNDK